MKNQIVTIPTGTRDVHEHRSPRRNAVPCRLREHRPASASMTFSKKNTYSSNSTSNRGHNRRPQSVSGRILSSRQRERQILHMAEVSSVFTRTIQHNHHQHQTTISRSSLQQSYFKRQPLQCWSEPAHVDYEPLMLISTSSQSSARPSSPCARMTTINLRKGNTHGMHAKCTTAEQMKDTRGIHAEVQWTYVKRPAHRGEGGTGRRQSKTLTPHIVQFGATNKFVEWTGKQWQFLQSPRQDALRHDILPHFCHFVSKARVHKRKHGARTESTKTSLDEGERSSQAGAEQPQRRRTDGDATGLERVSVRQLDIDVHAPSAGPILLKERDEEENFEDEVVRQLTEAVRLPTGVDSVPIGLELRKSRTIIPVEQIDDDVDNVPSEGEVDLTVKYERIAISPEQLDSLPGPIVEKTASEIEEHRLAGHTASGHLLIRQQSATDRRRSMHERSAESAEWERQASDAEELMKARTVEGATPEARADDPNARKPADAISRSKQSLNGADMMSESHADAVAKKLATKTPIWLQGSLGLSEESSRFELPMDMRELETITTREYLLKYCIMTSRRKALYQKIYLRHKDKNGLSVKDLVKALQDVLVRKLSPEEVSSILDLIGDINLEDDSHIDMKFFGGIAAVMERVMYPKYSTAATIDLPDRQKEKIECADFCMLQWKFHGIKVNDQIRKLLEAL